MRNPSSIDWIVKGTVGRNGMPDGGRFSPAQADLPCSKEDQNRLTAAGGGSEGS